MIIIRPDDVPLDEGESYHGGSGYFSRCTYFDDIKESSFNYARDITISSGTEIGIHKHEKDEEIFFFISGYGTVTVADEEQEVQPGTLVLTPPGLSHGVKNTGEADLRFFAVNTKHCEE